MFFNKIFLISVFLFSIILSNTLHAESITFGSSIYEGELKKGKAHGKGILTFSDDTIYEGNFKKNRPHGKGIYTDARENTYEGKWRNGKLKVKLDKKTRRIIKLSAEEGQTNFFEIKGAGNLISKWFEAEQNSEGEFVLTKKGKRDMLTAKQQAESDGNSDSGSGGSS